MAQKLKGVETQALVIDGSQPAAQKNDNFYDETVPALRLTMALLAVAMALGSGLALHDAKRYASDSDVDAEGLVKQRKVVRQQMAALLAKGIDLSKNGAIFDGSLSARFLPLDAHSCRPKVAREALDSRDLRIASCNSGRSRRAVASKSCGRDRSVRLSRFERSGWHN